MPQAITAILPLITAGLSLGTTIYGATQGGGGGVPAGFPSTPPFIQPGLTADQNAQAEQQKRMLQAAAVRRQVPSLIDQTGGSLTTPEYNLVGSQQAGTFGQPGWMGALDTLNSLPTYG